MKSFLLENFQWLDIFKETTGFEISGDKQYSSLWGIILSFMTSVTCIALISIYGQETILREKPENVVTEYVYQNETVINFDDIEYFFYASDNNGYKIKNLEDYYNLKIWFTSLNEKGEVQKAEYLNTTEIELCQNKHFTRALEKKHITEDYLTESIDFDHAYCIRNIQPNINIKNGYRNRDSSYVIIELDICDPKVKTCPDDIGKVTSEMYFYFNVLDSIYDPLNLKEPISYNFKQVNIQLSKSLKRVFLSMGINSITSDIGYVIQDERELDFTSLEQTIVYDNSLSQYWPNARCWITFDVSNYKKGHIREYVKIQEFFADVGGLISFFLYFVEITFAHYFRYNYLFGMRKIYNPKDKDEYIKKRLHKKMSKQIFSKLADNHINEDVSLYSSKKNVLSPENEIENNNGEPYQVGNPRKHKNKSNTTSLKFNPNDQNAKKTISTIFNDKSDWSELDNSNANKHNAESNIDKIIQKENQDKIIPEEKSINISHLSKNKYHSNTENILNKSELISHSDYKTKHTNNNYHSRNDCKNSVINEINNLQDELDNEEIQREKDQSKSRYYTTKIDEVHNYKLESIDDDASANRINNNYEDKTNIERIIITKISASEVTSLGMKEEESHKKLKSIKNLNDFNELPVTNINEVEIKTIEPIISNDKTTNKKKKKVNKKNVTIPSSESLNKEPELSQLSKKKTSVVLKQQNFEDKMKIHEAKTGESIYQFHHIDFDQYSYFEYLWSKFTFNSEKQEKYDTVFLEIESLLDLSVFGHFIKHNYLIEDPKNYIE